MNKSLFFVVRISKYKKNQFRIHLPKHIINELKIKNQEYLTFSFKKTFGENDDEEED